MFLPNRSICTCAMPARRCFCGRNCDIKVWHNRSSDIHRFFSMISNSLSVSTPVNTMVTGKHGCKTHSLGTFPSTGRLSHPPTLPQYPFHWTKTPGCNHAALNVCSNSSFQAVKLSISILRTSIAPTHLLAHIITSNAERVVARATHQPSLM